MWVASSQGTWETVMLSPYSLSLAEWWGSRVPKESQSYGQPGLPTVGNAFPVLSHGDVYYNYLRKTMQYQHTHHMFAAFHI